MAAVQSSVSPLAGLVKEGFEQPYLDDGRHVRPAVVEQILELFGKHFLPPEAPAAASSGASFARDVAVAAAPFGAGPYFFNSPVVLPFRVFCSTGFFTTTFFGMLGLGCFAAPLVFGAGSSFLFCISSLARWAAGVFVGFHPGGGCKGGARVVRQSTSMSFPKMRSFANSCNPSSHFV